MTRFANHRVRPQWIAARAAALLAAVALLAVAADARADAADEEDEELDPQGIAIERLVIQPAPEPWPALRYEMLPPASELRPGNAAALYTKACVVEGSNKAEQEAMKNISEWIGLPDDKVPWDEARKALQVVAPQLKLVEIAARRQTCEWDMTADQDGLFLILLPEVQMQRGLARALILKARLEAHEKRYDDALRTLQTGYAMGRHISQGPFIVQSLVGTAIVGITSSELQKFIQAPGAPNLYWALAVLPRPMVEIQQSIRFELEALERILPTLAEVESKNVPTDEWSRKLRELPIRIQKVTGMTPGELAESGGAAATAQAMYFSAAAGVAFYPQAKEYLVAHGVSREAVEKMPVAQVVLTHMVRAYRELRDENLKWMYVPHWQLGQAFVATQDSIKQAERSPATALFSLLMPATSAAQRAVVRTDRRIAAIQCVEALRMHAATTGGLPATLAEITVAPAPFDPMTGKEFQYSRQGNTATLIAPITLGGNTGEGIHFEIRLTEADGAATEKK